MCMVYGTAQYKKICEICEICGQIQSFYVLAPEPDL
jgi:hypothetical protein